MNVVIDLLHKSFVRDRLANINFDMADKSFRLLGYYFHHYSTLLWLAKQLQVRPVSPILIVSRTIVSQILGDIPNPTIVTVETIRKLRDMLDAVKEHDIRACFDNAYKRLKHFERTTATFEKFYSEISFLFNEGTLAAECHNSILKYYLLVNVALRTDGRYLPQVFFFWLFAYMEFPGLFWMIPGKNMILCNGNATSQMQTTT